MPQRKESRKSSESRPDTGPVAEARQKLRGLYRTVPETREELKQAIMDLCWAGMTGSDSLPHNLQCAKVLAEGWFAGVDISDSNCDLVAG